MSLILHQLLSQFVEVFSGRLLLCVCFQGGMKLTTVHREVMIQWYLVLVLDQDLSIQGSMTARSLLRGLDER